MLIYLVGSPFAIICGNTARSALRDGQGNCRGGQSSRSGCRNSGLAISGRKVRARAHWSASRRGLELHSTQQVAARGAARPKGQ